MKLEKRSSYLFKEEFHLSLKVFIMFDLKKEILKKLFRLRNAFTFLSLKAYLKDHVKKFT